MNKQVKQLVTIFFMGSSFGVIYGLPFIQYLLYDPLVKSIGATNAELGVLIAIFGIGNLIAPIGGILSDKFNHKTVYLLSVVASAILCFLFAFNLNYKFAIFIWTGMAITTLFGFFPAHIKIIRLLGTEKEQGKLFGFTESAVGIGSVLINFLLMYMFRQQIDEVAGFKIVVIGYGVFALIIGAILYFLIDGRTVEANHLKQQQKNNTKEDFKGKITTEIETQGILKDFLSVALNRGTLHASLSVFVVYSLYVSLSYFTPYFTDVLGVSVAFAGSIAIIRTYLVRIIGAPLGGMMGDLLGSNLKAILIALIASITVILIVMFLPAGTKTNILIALTLAISFFTYLARGNMFAVQDEVKTPRNMAGIVAGVVCAIGYSPDLFQFILFGNWLDTMGNDGYDYIFAYTVAILSLGVLNSLLALSYKRRLK